MSNKFTIKNNSSLYQKIYSKKKKILKKLKNKTFTSIINAFEDSYIEDDITVMENKQVKKLPFSLYKMGTYINYPFYKHND